MGLFFSVVVSVRVPRRLKEEMDRLGSDVNWSEKIRRVIERLPEAPRGTATGYVREDHDSR